MKINISPSELIHEDQSELSYLFSRIAECSRFGYHHVQIGLELAKWLLDEKNGVLLIEMHKEQIKKIVMQSSTKGIGYNFRSSNINNSKINCLPYLEIVFGNEDLTKNGTNWIIGHNNLLKFLEQPILLVEGFEDCDFFEFLLKAESKRSRIGQLSFNAHPVGGKGNMKKGIDRYSKKTGIIVCILDSDMYVPNGRDSNEFRAAERESNRRMANGKDRLFCIALKTPGHEAENFLPIDIIHEISNDESIKHTNRLKLLMDKPENAKKGQCVSLHYDYKDGVDQKKIQKNAKNAAQESWVKLKYGEYLDQLSSNVTYTPCNFKFYNYNFKLTINKKQSSQLPKYGGGIISNFINNREAKTQFDEYINKGGADYWQLHFSDWFEDFLWLFKGDSSYRNT